MSGIWSRTKNVASFETFLLASYSISFVAITTIFILFFFLYLGSFFFSLYVKKLFENIYYISCFFFAYEKRLLQNVHLSIKSFFFFHPKEQLVQISEAEYSVFLNFILI